VSLGGIVTEAAVGSGSLIAARLAAEQGREGFAVPGFVKQNTSRGTNALRKEGAALIERAQVCHRCGSVTAKTGAARTGAAFSGKECVRGHLGKEEQLVYDALSYDPLTVDEVMAATGLSVSIVMASLLSLVLRQRVTQLPGQYHLRA